MYHHRDSCLHSDHKQTPTSRIPLQSSTTNLLTVAPADAFSNVNFGLVLGVGKEIDVVGPSLAVGQAVVHGWVAALHHRNLLFSISFADNHHLVRPGDAAFEANFFLFDDIKITILREGKRQKLGNEINHLSKCDGRYKISFSSS